MNEDRYEKLKKYLLEAKIIEFLELPKVDSEPFVMGTNFFGESFEEAVDSLP